MATGVLHDPYTSEVITLVRGNQTGAAVQIDQRSAVVLRDDAATCPVG